MSNQPNPPPGKPTLLQEVGSVLASFFGVQSSKNRHRDFTRGNPYRFLVLGVVFTGMFVLSLLGVVKLIMSRAGL